MVSTFRNMRNARRPREAPRQDRLATRRIPNPIAALFLSPVHSLIRLGQDLGRVFFTIDIMRPMLRLRWKPWPSSETEYPSIARRILSATTQASSTPVPSSSTTNSSPPRRTSRSSDRSCFLIRALTPTRAWSPQACPNVSLITLGFWRGGPTRWPARPGLQGRVLGTPSRPVCRFVRLP